MFKPIKPPLGIPPRYISEQAYRTQRDAEIVAAMRRYNAVGKVIPVEWYIELVELWLADRAKNDTPVHPATLGRVFEGTFKVDERGGLSFNCSTQSVEFAEVLAGLTKLRDELNRQIENQQLCPHYTPPAQ